jgi:hypothetical protein
MTQVSKPSGPAPDWTLIEADYRAGIKSLRTIAEEHGITHGAINKRAKRDGWSRDLTAKIRAQADALVSKRAVSTEEAALKAATERQVVEANATLQFQIRMAHRKDIARGRDLWDKLCGELEATGVTRAEIERLLEANAETMTARQRDDARQTLVRMTAIGSRISSFNTLVHSLERLVKMERQAFGIGGEEGEEGDNPAHPAGFVPGHGRGLSDAERAIRLARLLQFAPQLAASLPAAAPEAPVPPGRE